MAKLYDQYLKQARHLAEQDKRGRPQQAHLRRAISTAYYALFHFLVDQACQSVVGTSPGVKAQRQLLARTFAHSEMQSAAKSFGGGNLPKPVPNTLSKVPRPVCEMADLFVKAQERRHAADYDLAESFTREGTLKMIEEIEAALKSWKKASNHPMAKLFLVSLLVWRKLERRR